MKSWQEISDLLTVDLIERSLHCLNIHKLLVDLELEELNGCDIDIIKAKIRKLLSEDCFKLKIWALGLNRLKSVKDDLVKSQVIEQLGVNLDQLLPNYDIPKKIHWIWLGSQLPVAYEKNLVSFINLNPDYSYHLWIDSAAITHTEKQLALSSMQKFCNANLIELHDIALQDKEPNFSEVLNTHCYNDWLHGLDAVKAFSADYLRLKILYIEGGVYVDADAECLAPFGNLNNDYGFRCLLKHYNKNEPAAVEVADNYFIASAARHPLVKLCIQEMELYYSTFMLNGYSFESIFAGQDVVHDQKAKRTNPLVFKRFNDAGDLCKSSRLNEEQINHNKTMEFAYRYYRFLEPSNLGYKLRFVGTLVAIHAFDRLLKQFYSSEAILDMQLPNDLIRHQSSRSWAKMSNRVLGVLTLDANRAEMTSMSCLSI